MVPGIPVIRISSWSKVKKEEECIDCNYLNDFRMLEKKNNCNEVINLYYNAHWIIMWI